jgi:hypothetical protein
MSSIMDMLGAGAAGGAAPPDLGGGAAAPPGADPASGGQPGQPDNPDAESALQSAIDAITQFLSAEQDDQDKAVAAKCLAQLQSIFGGRQKQDEAAAGITPAHKAMGRAMSSGAGAGGGVGY